MKNANTGLISPNFDKIHNALANKAPELLSLEADIARNVDIAYRHQVWAMATFEQCIDFEISYQRQVLKSKGVH